MSDNRLVRTVLNHKLTMPSAVLSFLYDMLSALVLLSSFVTVRVPLVSRDDAPLEPSSVVHLCAIAVCSVYQLHREAKQAMAFHKLKILTGYLKDGKNMLEVLTAATGLAVVFTSILGGGGLRASVGFRLFITTTAILVWFNLISVMRVVNRRLSAFVSTLIQTFGDLVYPASRARTPD